MEQFTTFVVIIAITISVMLSVEGFKIVIDELIAIALKKRTWGNVKYVLFIALGLTAWGVFAYGRGLLCLYGVEYTNEALRWFDLVTTATLASRGTNAVYDWIKSMMEWLSFVSQQKKQ